MITAYNKVTRQLTQVEHSWLLKPAGDWVVNPIIPDQVALIHAPNDTWHYDPATTVLRVSTPDELNTDPDRVAKAKEQQRNLLNNAAQAAIADGFVSSAVGTPHFYANSDQDRIALMAAILSTSPQPAWPVGTSMLFPCADIDVGPHPPVFVSHTNAQLKQVAVDGAAFKSTMMQQLAALWYAVDQATTVSDVQAINWSS